VHWPHKIAREDRREFDEIVTSFEPEYSGILNWLIEGVHIFLKEGLVIPEAVNLATQEYRDEMDRTAGFVARCIVKEANADPVQGKDLYAAYVDDTDDQGGKPMTLNAFGRIMGKKFQKERTATGVVYHGIRISRGGQSTKDAPPDYGPPPHDEIPDW
jgi:putative DNA primase/helicase